jgi:hypothetical protein
MNSGLVFAQWRRAVFKRYSRSLRAVARACPRNDVNPLRVPVDAALYTKPALFASFPYASARYFTMLQHSGEREKIYRQGHGV